LIGWAEGVVVVVVAEVAAELLGVWFDASLGSAVLHLEHTYCQNSILEPCKIQYQTSIIQTVTHYEQ
jgi:hypothetical protein